MPTKPSSVEIASGINGVNEEYLKSIANALDGKRKAPMLSPFEETRRA
jgi:hypothetical protein